MQLILLLDFLKSLKYIFRILLATDNLYDLDMYSLWFHWPFKYSFSHSTAIRLKIRYILSTHPQLAMVLISIHNVLEDKDNIRGMELESLNPPLAITSTKHGLYFFLIFIIVKVN